MPSRLRLRNLAGAPATDDAARCGGTVELALAHSVALSRGIESARGMELEMPEKKSVRQRRPFTPAASSGICAHAETVARKSANVLAFQMR